MADQDAERLDAYLARRLPGLSRTHARRLIDEGLVQVDGVIERASYRLGFGEMVRVWPEHPASPVAEAEDIPLDVRYEDADVIVINKPAGLTVHPAPGQPTGTVVNALLAHCPDLQAIGDAIRPGLVHRLDKDTSGVMMVAKNAAAMAHLQDQIRVRSVEKRYAAVVAGIPDPLEGIIDAAIARDRVDPRRMAVDDRGRPSRTDYRVVEQFVDASLLDCHLITGRTHQIRVHLTAIGQPILGDRIYGQGSDLIDRQALHARRLAFDHPRSGERLAIEVELSADMERLLAALRAGRPVHGRDLGGIDPVAAEAPRAGRARRADRSAWRPSRHRSQHIR